MRKTIEQKLLTQPALGDSDPTGKVTTHDEKYTCVDVVPSHLASKDLPTEIYIRPRQVVIFDRWPTKVLHTVDTYHFSGKSPEEVGHLLNDIFSHNGYVESTKLLDEVRRFIGKPLRYDNVNRAISLKADRLPE